jgi:LmbE family N-acetylglucosaminyl deacetylase
MLNIPPDAVHPFPPSGSLLVVSPHFDDAALSCAALLDRGEPADVLTIFAGAPEPPQRGWWDERCGFASSAESVPARRREDESALAPGGHRILLLDLLELQYLEGPRPSADADRIDEAVRDWLAESSGGTVAVPAGAGWAPHRLPPRVARRLREPRGPEPHHDHVFTRDALLRAGLDDASLVLYEELPYFWGGSAARAARRAASEHGYRAHLEVAPVDRERKAARLTSYASQIPHISPPEAPLDSPTVLPSTERYWRLRRR